MTMKVTEHKLTAKRKRHPNDGRYPCRSSQEVLQAGMKLMASLPEHERKLLKDNELIIDEEETAELYDAIKEKDIIGLGLLRKTGFISNKYEVEKIIPEEDYMICKNLLTELEEEISFQDVSIGFALGFAEILYRDEKPFGVSDEIEFTLKVKQEENENEDEDAEKSEISESQDLAENDKSTTKGMPRSNNDGHETKAEETTAAKEA